MEKSITVIFNAELQDLIARSDAETLNDAQIAAAEAAEQAYDENGSGIDFETDLDRVSGYEPAVYAWLEVFERELRGIEETVLDTDMTAVEINGIRIEIDNEVFMTYLMRNGFIEDDENNCLVPDEGTDIDDIPIVDMYELRNAASLREMIESYIN